MNKIKTFVTVKKYGYLVIFIMALLPVLSFYLMRHTSFPILASYLSLLVVFVLVPLLDILIGQDELNLDEKLEVPKLEQEYFYRFMVLMSLPAFFALLVFGAWAFVSLEMTFFQALGWLLSIGLFGAVFGINSAHELCHKTTKIEPFFSGLLLSLVCYSTFKVEHIRGHHVYVSTPDDRSSAAYNQNLYHFLWRTLSGNFMAAFKLEAHRLRKRGLSAWNFRNELIWWQLLSLTWLILAYAFFGFMGAVFFLAQSFMAITFLEIINYVEHYGLERKKLKNGKYEPVSHKHSWNSSYLLTNLLLFQLQRHSDHHAYPKRRYQVLRHFKDSPQLPFGYATMILLALFPPLWFRCMNKKVENYLGYKPQVKVNS